uniref:Ig-like domain-containing protein n=1 Tax=Stegastes partitus TaxID=144197 RepID=A0A3B4ZG53_9TELE
YFLKPLAVSPLLISGLYHYQCCEIHAKFLQSVIKSGGSVMLTCSVDEDSGWKYYWFRRTSWSSTPERIKYDKRYRECSVLSFNQTTFFNKSVVTRHPNWPQIFRGETITLRCEIQDGGNIQWEYEWRTTSSEKTPENTERWVISTSESSDGDYRCRGKLKSDSFSSTEWSDNTSVLTVSVTSLVRVRTGGSVTLTCSVDEGSGWKYYWFRRTSPSSTPETIEDETLSHTISISEGGIYHCRGERGDPVFYTKDSEAVIIEKRGECSVLFLKPLVMSCLITSSQCHC